jgi:hypothetical protein
MYVLRLEDERVLRLDARGCRDRAERLRGLLAAVPPPPGADALEREKLLADKVAAHDFGDTKRRRVRYRAAATSRFREYFPPGLWDDLARTSTDVEVDLPATARPAAPAVRYVLPTFGWTRDDGDGSVTSRRHGGSLRVYLERGWWSSGEGELLAVVLGQYLPDKTDPLYRYSTFWGQDPMRESPPLELPTAAAFRGAAVVATRVALAELSGRTVTVVGYEPHFDERRQLWTVDLSLPSGGHYFPMVRLALARFQPHALDDVRLSSVVTADVVQTAPDRTLTVTRDGAAAGRYRVHVAGATYQGRRIGSVRAIGPSVMRARLERRVPTVPDDELAWWTLPGSTDVVLPATQLDGDVQHWEGDVAVPDDAQGDTVRVVVHEVEQHAGWTTVRVVYADAVVLTD